MSSDWDLGITSEEEETSSVFDEFSSENSSDGFESSDGFFEQRTETQFQDQAFQQASVPQEQASQTPSKSVSVAYVLGGIGFVAFLLVTLIFILPKVLTSDRTAENQGMAEMTELYEEGISEGYSEAEEFEEVLENPSEGADLVEQEATETSEPEEDPDFREVYIDEPMKETAEFLGIVSSKEVYRVNNQLFYEVGIKFIVNNETQTAIFTPTKISFDSLSIGDHVEITIGLTNSKAISVLAIDKA